MEYLRFILSFLTSVIINIFHKQRTTFHNILLIRLDHIGDMICSLQAIGNVKNKYPNAKIILLTGHWNSTLFFNSNLVDEIIVYNSPAFSRDKINRTSFRQRMTLLKKLFDYKFDLIIGFRDDFFTVLSSFLLMPVRRLDRGSIRIITKYKKQVNRKSIIAQHEIEINKEIVFPLLDKFSAQNTLFFFTDNEKKWLNSFLEANQLNRKSYAVIHPGASWEYKRWDSKNFQQIGKFIFEKYKLKTIIVGTIDEQSIGKKISEGFENIFIDLIGLAELRQTIILLTEAKIAICNDSAPMHIASQLGVPTVGLMSSAEIEKFSPRGAFTFYLHKKLDCHPCNQKICVRPDSPCVNLITSLEVQQKIIELINLSNDQEQLGYSKSL